MKKAKFTLWDLVASVLFGFIFFLILVALITPEKDKNGNYTQPYKYWTDSAYYEANF